MKLNQRFPLMMAAFLAPMLCWSSLQAEVADDACRMSLVAGNTAFAFDLYHQLKSGEGNQFFSPYSISTALAMTWSGARENTAKQMSQVLHFALKRTEIFNAFACLETELNAVQERKNVELSVANALWAEKTNRFLEGFVVLVKKTFRAELKPTDFKTACESARGEINTWVEKQTRGKIRDLIQPGILSSLTRLALVNAIYFKGAWADQFDISATRDAPFLVSPDRNVNAPMMCNTSRFNYMEDDDLQIVELPYKGKDLSMIILLPKQVDGLERLEGALNAEALTRWLGRLAESRVTVHLPRFRATSTFDLAETLASMGMPDAFAEGRADFSGMDGTKMLYVSAVIHKAFVDVNEQGTEAAAATAVVMAKSAFDPRPIPVFRADHPFLFFIRDKHSESILFLGRMTDPSA